MNRTLSEVSSKITSLLLVEDDQDDQELITEALRAIDPHLAIHTISKSNNVLPFLESRTDTQLPQLIVLDYNLPEMDGAELLQQLSAYERYKNITKIIWSTSNLEQYKMRCLAFGAAQYLVKPATIGGIEKMAKQFLELCQTAI